jgi:hypothetical protein
MLKQRYGSRLTILISLPNRFSPGPGALTSHHPLAEDITGRRIFSSATSGLAPMKVSSGSRLCENAGAENFVRRFFQVARATDVARLPQRVDLRSCWPKCPFEKLLSKHSPARGVFTQPGSVAEAIATRGGRQLSPISRRRCLAHDKSDKGQKLT